MVENQTICDGSNLLQHLPLNKGVQPQSVAKATVHTGKVRLRLIVDKIEERF